MGAVKKYFGPINKAGWWLLFHLPKIKRYDKKKDSIPFEDRYAFALKIYDKVTKAFNIEFEITGLERIKDKHTLIVSNHQSYYDPFISQIFDFPVSFVAKKEIAKFPFVGHVAKSIDVVFMDREDPRDAVKVFKEASEILSKGRSMWITPEGTRSKNEGHEMNEFKPGSFKPAYRTQVPVTLLALNGTYKVFEKKCYKKLIVQIEILEQIPYEQYKDKTTQELSDYCFNKINDKFHEFKENDK